MLKGFLFMNNYCLFNNLAAMSFKVLLQQGVSVLVFAFFRNIVLLVLSTIAYFLLHRKCLSGGRGSSSSEDDPCESQQNSGGFALKIFNRRFIMA